MGLFDSNLTQSTLDDLLDRERYAILNGKYEQLDALLEEKERLSAMLGEIDIDAEALKRLREKSERNSLLYDAMRAGIGSALERLRALKDANADLKTYDQAGGRKSITSAQATTERRA